MTREAFLEIVKSAFSGQPVAPPVTQRPHQLAGNAGTENISNEGEEAAPKTSENHASGSVQHDSWKGRDDHLDRGEEHVGGRCRGTKGAEEVFEVIQLCVGGEGVAE